MTQPIAYFSFDTVPAPKGAATHIEAFVKTLGATVGPVQLVTVAATPNAEETARWPGVYHTALPALGKTLIDRVIDFRQRLWHWLQGRHFEVIQVRSIFEGLPIALNREQFCRYLIFEVNGLPSIELKYRYPQVADDRELMHKLRSQEHLCLHAATHIITPSPITRDYLIQAYGVPAEKLTVIPNGVDLGLIPYQPPALGNPLEPLQLLYFGTLSAWQGVSLALDALALYCRDFEAELTVIGPARSDQITALEKLADRWQVADRLHILPPLPQIELVRYLHKADAIAAPLTANDRNMVQGCCPLKVLEGMASGTPVITSDLPVVTALGQPEIHFLTTPPGSAKGIKEAMVRLRQDGDLRQRLSSQARQQVEQHYTWEQAGAQLVAVYEGMRG
ncbi:MAG: glycosyltransferase family 4 protein [Cyanobacteria bacterium Co-bin8]|nr:glycosyltransferase family 4 protein [Cyanobacteria bacterium Co-bin8]